MNDLLSVWSTVGSVLLAILILLVMITVHEFGHYLAGRLLKFRINEFSIGFGPALFKHRNKRTGELFAVRLIPLGGYCAFEGEDGLDEPAPAAPEAPDTVSETPAPMSESAQPMSTAPAPMSESAQPMSTAPETVSGTDEPVSAAPEKRTSEAQETPAVPRGARFTEKKPWERIVVLLAGALMNYLLALVFLLVLFAGYGQTMVAVYHAVPPGEIPEAYCLRDYDILLQAEGHNLYLTTDVARALNGKKEGDFAELRISRRFAETTEEGDSFRREEMTVKVMLRADVEVANSADTDAAWRALGVRYERADGTEGDEAAGDGAYSLASASYRFGFFETIGRAFAYSFRIAGSIFRILGELLTGRLGLGVLGGPVTTIAMTSEIAGRSVKGFLEIAGFIGVNLAVFNLLPIPALDGSKIVFTIIEWVRKKPVSRKVEAVIHAVGFVLLLGFAILVDILQFV